jgi:hypothetical protein
LKLNRSINNLTKKLDRLEPHPLPPHISSSDSRTGLNHWKGKPIISLDDWIEIRNTPCALDYFPDDFDRSLTYIELPYYRYEFERNKRRIEAKRQSDGWLNDEVGYGAICHDSMGNLIDGLGNPIKEVEEMIEEEEEQHQDEELRLRFRLKQEQEDIEQWHSNYIELMKHTKNLNYISHCANAEVQRIF